MSSRLVPLASLIKRLDKEFSRNLVQQIFSHAQLTKSDAKTVFSKIRNKNQHDLASYGLFLSFLARTGDKEGVLFGINQAQADGFHAKWYGVLGMMYAACGQLKPALYVLESAPKPMPDDFGFCVNQLGTSPDALSKFEVLWDKHETSGVSQLHSAVASAFIAQYGKLGDMVSVSRWLDRMKAKNQPLNIGIQQLLLTTNADMELAKHLIGEIKRRGEEPSRSTFNALISLAANQADRAVLQHWVKEMKAANFQPDIMTFTSLIKAAATDGDHAAVQRYLSEMEAARIKPTESIYKPLIMESEDFSMALKWYQQMKDAKLFVSTVTFNALIKLAALQGDWNSVQQLLGEMKTAGASPNQLTFNTVIAQSALIGDAEASHWLQVMKTAGISPTIVTMYGLIASVASRKDVLSIQHWLGRMKEAGFVPSIVTYNEIISKMDDEREARRWYDEMKQLGLKPSIMTFKYLVSLAAKHSDQAALDWIEELKREGLQLESRLYYPLLDYAENVDKVNFWMREMKKEGIVLDISSYSKLIKFAIRSGNEDRAKFWLAETRKARGQLRLQDFVRFVEAAAALGDEKAVQKWIQESRDAGFEPTPGMLVARGKQAAKNEQEEEN